LRDSEGNGIKNRRTAVSRFELGNGPRCFRNAVGEAVRKSWSAIKPNDGHFVRDICYQIFEEGLDMLIVIQSRSCSPPGLYDNSQRKRLVSGLFFNLECLGDAVIKKPEVLRV
jgi:hypothetical protein